MLPAQPNCARCVVVLDVPGAAADRIEGLQSAVAACCRLQDRLEQQEGRYAVRRQPLGADRFNRSYWWGLAGNKDALLLQQEVGGAEETLELLAAAAKDAAVAAAAGPSAADMMASVFAGGGKTPGSAGKAGSSADADAADAGQVDSSVQQQQGRGAGLDHKGLMLGGGPEGWAMLSQPDQVEALMAACEVRGVREKELKANLEKVSLVADPLQLAQGLMLSGALCAQCWGWAD